MHTRTPDIDLVQYMKLKLKMSKPMAHYQTHQRISSSGLTVSMLDYELIFT